MHEMNGMSKTRRILMTIAIWISSFSVMYSMLTVVILNDLYIAFPEGEFYITATLSWPFILVGVSGFVAGALLKRLSTKTELIIAGILILAGLVPRYVQTAEVVLVFVLIQGIGAGFANTAGMAIISEVFTDETKRAKQMGYYNFVMAIMGVVISFGGGMLAVSGWQFAYDVYWIALPMLVLCIIFLPNIKPSERLAEAPIEASEVPVEKRRGFGGRFVTFFIACFLWSMAWSLLQGFVSVYLAENMLGDVAFAGACTSLTTAGSAVCCVLFGFFFPKLRRKVTCVAFILAAIVYIALWLAPSVPLAAIGCLLGGGCYGTMFTVIYAYGAACVTPEQNGMAMGLMTLNYSLASSIGIYLWSFLMGITGTVTGCLPYAAVILAIALVIEVVNSIRDDKQRFLMDAPGE